MIIRKGKKGFIKFYRESNGRSMGFAWNENDFKDLRMLYLKDHDITYEFYEHNPR